MYTKFVFLLLIQLSSQWALNSNIGKVIRLDHEKINTVLVSNIKSVKTKDGIEIELPKDLQHPESDNTNKHNSSKRLTDICYFQKKTYDMDHKSCLQAIQSVETNLKDEAKVALLKQGEGNFQNSIKRIFLKRKSDLEKGGAPFTSGEMHDKIVEVLKENVEKVLKQKVVNKVDEQIQQKANSLESEAEKVANSPSNDIKIIEAEHKALDLANSEGVQSLEGVKKLAENEIEKVVDEIKDSSIEKQAYTTASAINSIDMTISDEKRAEITDEIKREVQNQKDYILEKLKEEKGIEASDQDAQIKQQEQELDSKIEQLIQEKLDKVGHNIVKQEVTKIVKDKVEDTVEKKVGNLSKEGSVELTSTLL